MQNHYFSEVNPEDEEPISWIVNLGGLTIHHCATNVNANNSVPGEFQDLCRTWSRDNSNGTGESKA